MQRIHHYFNIIKYSLKVDVLRQLEYPTFLLGWFLSIPIFYCSSIALLYVLTTKFQNLNGWGFHELLFIYGLGLLSHGMFVIFFNEIFNTDRNVLKGEFDRLLLRPVNSFFYYITRSVTLIGIGDIYTAGLIFIIACRSINLNFNIVNILKILIIILSGVFIRVAIYSVTATLAFWTKASRPLLKVSQNIVQNSTLYPISIYPVKIQFLFTYLIPVGFISFYPANELLDKNGTVFLKSNFILFSFLTSLFFLLIGYKFFCFGLKRYESSGT